MDNSIAIAIISSASTLLAVWVTQRMAAQRDAILAAQAVAQEAADWQRDQDDKQTALRREKREVFLGLVLLVQDRVMDAVDRLNSTLESGIVAAESTPASSARQAYSVALIYLADMRPLAKDFYQYTAKLQMILPGKNAAKINEVLVPWRKTIDEIEKVIASGD
ncbi:MAG: hypothetical protein PHP85_14600 [Gallionella sp.]|nr:hypothetical protein [Gallionella sp.]